LAKHHFEEHTTRNEETFEQLHVTRSIMHSPLYPKTTLKKKKDDIMIEKEKSFLSIPGRPRKKSQEEPSNKGKDPEIEIIGTRPPQTSKKIDEII